MNLSDVIGNLGGVQQVVFLIIGFVFYMWANISLIISMINHMYDVKTNDNSLNCREKKLEINSFDKVRLMTNCCPNKKMKRFIKKGQKLLEKDLDLMEIIKEHKHN